MSSSRAPCTDQARSARRDLDELNVVFRENLSTSVRWRQKRTKVHDGEAVPSQGKHWASLSSRCYSYLSPEAPFGAGVSLVGWKLLGRLVFPVRF
jgi:hypothetical protein